MSEQDLFWCLYMRLAHTTWAPPPQACKGGGLRNKNLSPLYVSKMVELCLKVGPHLNWAWICTWSHVKYDDYEFKYWFELENKEEPKMFATDCE